MTKLIPAVAGLVAAIGFSAANAQFVTRFDELNKFASTKSRAEVQMQANAAVAAGQIEYGEATRFAVVLDGPPQPVALVRAEGREAMRLGLLRGGEVTVFATPQQREQIRIAGLKAVADMPVAQAR